MAVPITFPEALRARREKTITIDLGNLVVDGPIVAMK
jgi:hypothetical protein